MKPHFQSMATYSAWANKRLITDAWSLPREQVHRNVGVYFSSLLGTFTHLLQSDRAWMFILAGGSLEDMALAPPPVDLAGFQVARQAQDEAFIAWIEALDDPWFDCPFRFVSGLGTLKGMTYNGTNGSALTHVLNHQTHHRGQAHAALTFLGVSEPLALDVLVKGFIDE